MKDTKTIINDLLKIYSKEELLEQIDKIDKLKQKYKELHSQKTRAAQELTNFVVALFGETLDTNSSKYREYFIEIFNALTILEKEISIVTNICNSKKINKEDIDKFEKWLNDHYQKENSKSDKPNQKKREAEKLTNFVLVMLGKPVDPNTQDYKDYFKQNFNALTNAENAVASDIDKPKKKKREAGDSLILGYLADDSKSDDDILQDFIKMFKK